MTPFFWEKVFFEMGEQLVLLIVVLKSCVCVFFFSENAIFIVFFQRTQQLQYKTVCKQKQKLMKNSGLFLNLAKGCFFLFVSFSRL